MRRLFVLVTALSLVAAVPAAEPPGWTTVGEEVCIAGPDDDQLTSPDWEDLCSVAWRTVASGPDTPTTIEVRLRAVGDVEDRVGPVYYATAWESADCQFVLAHRDETAADPGVDVLRVRCDDQGIRCDIVEVGTDGADPCRDDAGVMIDVPIAPSFAGTDVVWTVTFDGELAEVAHLHAVGAEVVPTVSMAGDELSVETNNVAPVAVPHASLTVEPYTYRYCVFGWCPGLLDDGIAADRTYTIG